MRNQTISNQVLQNQIALERVGRYEAAQNRRTTRPRRSSHEIKTLTLVGLLMMLTGFSLLAYQGIRYTVEMQSSAALSSGAPSRQINLPLSPLVDITAMFAGYVLIVRERD